MRTSPNSIFISILTISFFVIMSQAHAEAVNAKGEYLYGPDTSAADACRLAEERAKANALSKVFGESISMEEQMSCREIRGGKPDYGCELNRVSWSSIEGDIRSVKDYRKVIDSRAGESACIVTLTADVVLPDRKPDSSFDLKATLNEKVYRTGDVLTISLEPTVPMHIAIFNWVPYLDRDTVTQMFPNSMDLDSYITKKTYIPTENKSPAYDFTMTWLESLPKNKTFVDEYLIVIGTKKPIKWLSSYELDDFKIKLREIPLDERRVVKRGYQLIRGSSKVGSVQ
jgi:hypothetical protein